MKEMTADEVINLYKLLEENGISIIVDGGWGIDALIGEQTRKHNDLDIAVDHKNVPKLCELLEAKGYKDINRPDSKEYNFALGDNSGHEVDVHSYTLDENGNNVYGIAYPFASLSGKGSINGFPINCIALEYVIQFHENYEPDADDIEDIKALCSKFRIKPPRNYPPVI